MLILFLITLCASIFFTWYVKRILLKARIADNPIVSEHRHKSGTPTMGGIAFLFTISLIMALYYQNTPILILSFIMLAGGIGADIREADIQQALFPGTAENTGGEYAFKHFGEDGEDINCQKQPPPAVCLTQRRSGRFPDPLPGKRPAAPGPSWCLPAF